MHRSQDLVTSSGSSNVWNGIAHENSSQSLSLHLSGDLGDVALWLWLLYFLKQKKNESSEVTHGAKSWSKVLCVLGLSLFKKPPLTLTLPPRVVRLTLQHSLYFFQYGVIQLWVLTLWCNLEYYSVPPVLVILAFSQASGKPPEDDWGVFKSALCWTLTQLQYFKLFGVLTDQQLFPLFVQMFNFRIKSKPVVCHCVFASVSIPLCVSFCRVSTRPPLPPPDLFTSVKSLMSSFSSRSDWQFKVKRWQKQQGKVKGEKKKSELLRQIVHDLHVLKHRWQWSKKKENRSMLFHLNGISSLSQSLHWI